MRLGRYVAGHPGLVTVIAVAAAVLAVYGQSLWFGYVNYDDGLITDRTWIELRELSWDGLRRMFAFTGQASFQPIRHLAFALVYGLWGIEPFGYHLFNLLFYLANLWVVFLVLKELLHLSSRFKDSRRAAVWAGVGTVWFAVHPVHVESVAWMISNKELLAGLFYFLSFLCYLVSWKRGFSLARYLGSWAFLALGMLSKPSVAALPLVILAFEYIYRRDKLDWKLLALRVGPFLALAGAGALYYVFYTSAFTEFLHSSLRIHSLTMATVLAKYIKIFLVPVNLCNSYPPPFFMGTYNYRLAIYLLVDAGLILALVHTLRTGRKALSFGIIFFLLNLLPVSGIMPISIFMADRYLYLSSLGFIFAGLVLLAGLWDSLEVSSRARRWFVAAGATGLIFLACISTVRCRDWKDAITLWGSAVREYPNFQFNHYGLGVALKNAGRPRDALQAFERVNMFREHMMTTCYIGMIMDELGDSARADSLYLRVIQLGERNKQEDAMLAAVYKRLGRMDEAADRWLSLGKMNKHIPYQVKKYARKLLEHGYTSQAGELVAEAADGADPSEGMLTFLVEIMASSGDPRQAGLVIERALSSGEDSLGLLPAMADVQYSLGNRDQALALYSRVPAWSLRPSQLERLAAEYYSRGRLTEALEAFILLRDSNAGRPAASAHNNVGVVLEAMDSLETARAEYLRAVELKPDYADAWFNLGNLARKRRQMEDALGYYRHVRSLEGFSAPVQSAIGAVLIEIGSYTEAFEAFREVLDADSTAPGALLGAADALWLAGRKSEAAACYSRLLELGRQQNLEVPGYARQRAN